MPQTNGWAGDRQSRNPTFAYQQIDFIKPSGFYWVTPAAKPIYADSVVIPIQKIA